ncbi:MAG: NnrU family protein [Rhizobiaceae bacterium]|jgi:uncharacterized membrane protein|nr:NnrU family protein [Rhizobiaceae bacterium]
MIGFCLGLVLFLGVHLVKVLAPGWRNARIAAGEGAYKGAYSLAALAGLALIIWFYRDAQGALGQIWNPPLWLQHVNALLMLFALVFFVSASLPAGRIKAAVKHPQLLSVKIWAFGHLLANGDGAALLMFGAFLAWAVIVRVSIKGRERRGEAVPPVAGPVKWDAIAIAGGLALYAALIFGGHEWLFGVAPLTVG